MISTITPQVMLGEYSLVGPPQVKDAFILLWELFIMESGKILRKEDMLSIVVYL